MPLKTKHFYEFGNFRLDLTEKVLLRENDPVPLTPKVFDTLCVLLENAGHLIEKEELMQKIWQDHFVEENNLTFNIKMLRRALGDDASQPRFIKTVPRRGYRFIAEVREIFEEGPDKLNPAGNNATSPPLPPPPSAASINRKNPILPYAGISILAIVSIGMGFWFSQGGLLPEKRSAPILSAPFKSKPFSNSGKTRAVISPDGKYVAYTDEAGGKESVWLRQLETSENIQIISPSEAAILGMTFSNDGNSLYFVQKPKADPNTSALYRVAAFGGVPVKILDKLEGWISLSPDDKNISFVRCGYTENEYCSLSIADADGKNERKLVTRPRPIRISGNEWSPNGKSIAFAAGQSANGSSDFGLFQFDLESGKESPITPEKFFNINDLSWLPDGEALLFLSSKNMDGMYKVWQVSAETGEVRQLANDSLSYMRISLDKNASKMIATQVSSDFQLFLSPADNFNNSRAVTVGFNVTFTPSGKIVFVSSAENSGDIWIMNADGSQRRQLTNSVFAEFSPRVSPDERYIYFTSNRSGANQIWRMNIDGTEQTQLTTRHGGYPRFVTPDGKWIYFESGLDQKLRAVAATGGEEIQILEDRVYAPSFSPDGTLMAYFIYAREKNNQAKIVVSRVHDKKIIKIVDLINDKSQPVHIAWLDNNSFSYIFENEAKKLVWKQSLDAEQPLFLADLGEEDIRDFAASPNGEFLAFSRGKWIYDSVLIEGLK